MPLHLDDIELTLRRARRERLWQPGPATQALDLRGEALERLLLHRPPFLLIQAITAFDRDQAAIEGRGWIDPADPVLRGHFPGNPVYPGALLVETLAQTMACVQPLESGGPPAAGFGTSFRGVFLRPVRPGDALTLLAVRVGETDEVYARAVGQVLRGEEVCAVALVEACYVDP